MRNPIIEVARKTNLGNYCLALLRKGGYIEWDETKFGRGYKLAKDGYNIHQAREPDIIQDLIEGSANVGITRKSYLAQKTGVWPEVGAEIGNLSVVGEMTFCPDILIPVASVAARKSKKRVLVSPQIEKIVGLLYDELKDYDRYPAYSIPSGLKLGAGFIGIARVSPLNDLEFKGDIGEDGYPYPRLKSYGIQAVSKADIEGNDISLSEYFDYPVLIKNNEHNGDVDDLLKDLVHLSDRLGNSVETVEYIKRDGIYESQPVRSRSVNKSVLEKISNDFKANTFLYENSIGKNYTPSSVMLISYKAKATDLGLNLPRKPMLKETSSLENQISKASRNGVEYLLIFGEDEEREGKITIKNMKTREQSRIGYDEIRKKVMEPEETSDVILVQEAGVPGYGRRLNGPGEAYAKANGGLLVVYSNYRDMVDLLFEGRAKEGVLGYDRFIESLLNHYAFERIPEIDEFNSFALQNRIPFEVERIGGSECEICLAGPIPEMLNSLAEVHGVEPSSISDTIVTEFPNISNVVIRDFTKKPSLRVVTGATEVYPNPVVDAVLTGDTLRRNGKRVEKPLFKSDAIVARRV